MAPPAVSALGLALNGKSAFVDIPKPRDSVVAGRDTLTGSSHQRDGGILTPPHSLSPNLPPTGRASDHSGVQSNLGHLDLDVDLHDAPEEITASALSAEALDSLGDLDSAGAITPGLLAKHHLPDILLSHGPLAIRHIMGYLTTSVPGFSRITSAKARRLVVAALEGRGSGTEGGGISGQVVFDKVGWGRWDARLKGQPPREHTSTITPPGSLPSSYSMGLQVPGPSHHSGSDRYGTSITANSAVFSQSEEYEDQDMLEMEVDKMSLDGNDEAYASSEAPDPIDQDLGEGEVTDEEDWASIGAEALRARSLPKSPRIPAAGGRIYQPIASYSIAPSYRSKTPAANLAQSAPTRHGYGYGVRSNHSSLPKDAGVNTSEQAAIEALLSMGAM